MSGAALVLAFLAVTFLASEGGELGLESALGEGSPPAWAWGLSPAILDGSSPAG